MPALRVFISYTQESVEQSDRVLELANRLRDDGIDVVIDQYEQDPDQYEQDPPEGWPLWMQRQIQSANFVLILCTQRYLKRANGTEEPGKGHGVAWESVIAMNELYLSPHMNTKFIPIFFA